MNILIGFEESGVIRDGFRSAGHNAYSCDLQPPRTQSDSHLKMDIYRALELRSWDLIILHPECTALTVAGNHIYAEGKEKHNERLAAIDFTRDLWAYCVNICPRVALENPVGVLHSNTDLPKPQYIQPYNFGNDASKKTGLTIQGLPRLIPTNRIKGRFVEWPKGSGKIVERWANQTDSGQNNVSPSETRKRDRSQTYVGIMSAIVDQWGGIKK